MEQKKLLLCTVVGTVFLLIIDYLWYGVLMTGTYEDLAGIMRPMPLFLWLVISYLIFTSVFCYLFPATSSGNRMSEGIKFGFLVGLMVYGSYNLMRYGTETVGSLSIWVMDVVYNMVKIGILGAIIALLSAGAAGSRGDETKKTGGQ